ncbi:RIP metalloprotease RseP [Prosthecochloris sp. SCSIO W1103]|uniref:RIP metalloprotease RseP n=1 Tax=Prosthecochloris sp. SCSIO W1103 TaxID=2992244 RepID=UPI00223D7B8C|nr:RIP metalloprotease RseP [Prosthecochloris sp. SCSIO W1103]UZJ37702.1 RIP metalloprotease RseP [Prosthecochloris sp. SCSIO W1103]
MDFLSTTFYFIIAIFILVTAHELGHFLAAKLFGMRVDKFYIGFDFYNLRLWKKKIGDTEYGIGAFPLGGYVKIAGMVDESLDTDFQKSEPEPWEFRAKPVWQRLIVLAGGVAMNMILAAAIFIAMASVFGESRTSVVNPAYVEEGSVYESMGMQTGDRFVAVNGQPVQYWEEVLSPKNFAGQTLTYTVLQDENRKTLRAPADILTRINENQALGIRPLMAPVIDQVLGNQPAEKAGLKPGALITAINDEPVHDWTEVVDIISANPGQTISVAWKYLAPPADDGTVDVSKIREFGTQTVSDIVPTSTGKIGIALKQTLVIDHRQLNLADATTYGLEQTWNLTVTTVQGFGKILTGKEDFRKSLGGPIKIARIANQSAEQGLSSFLYFLALLSISLAFINILPIPALDGGQFVLNAIEGIIGREIPFQLKMRIQQIGMALLLTLFLFFIINDIINP